MSATTTPVPAREAATAMQDMQLAPAPASLVVLATIALAMASSVAMTAIVLALTGNL